MVIALLWFLFTLALFTLENHWFMFFTTTQSPDLLLLFLLLFALDQGERKGALYGLGIGALLDVVTFSYFGWHMVTRTLIGFVIGRNRMNMFADRLPTYSCGYAQLCVVQGRWLPLWPLLVLTVKCILWNCVCAPVMWFLYHRFKNRIRSRRDYYYHV